MRVKILQIVWHNKEPVFSLDFHPSGLLATCGADGEIKLWEIVVSEEGSVAAEFLRSITGDKCESGYKTWNCVRFCPTGQSLAAAGDGGQIYVWRPPEAGLTSTEASWKPSNCGAYSAEDVVDLCWAADGSGFVTASNDMSCMFWDPEAKKGKAKLRLEGHRLYVQGVAWDPHHRYIVSQGADRSCRVYSMRPAVQGLKEKSSAANKPAIHRLDGMYCAHVINKSILPKSKPDATEIGREKPVKKNAGQHLFLDESLSTFFRRLAWSPDGSMLVVPAGIRKAEESAHDTYVAYIFVCGVWNTPLMQLPALPKPAIAVRFCPIIFELEQPEPPGLALPIELPYRMVFAVATKDSVILYDTQAATPLAILGNLHLEVITDLAWSPEGRTLAISSYDSYCSIACFEEGELGRPCAPEQLPSHVRSMLWATVAGQHENGITALSGSQAAISTDPRNTWNFSAEAGVTARQPLAGSVQMLNVADPETALHKGDKSDVAATEHPVSGTASNATAWAEMSKRPIGAPCEGPSGFKRVRRIAPTAILPSKQSIPIDHLEAVKGATAAAAAPPSVVAEEQAAPQAMAVSIADRAAAAGKTAAVEAQTRNN